VQLGFNKTKTLTSILFLNTVGDPVTPISSARHMQQYFEGSVVLTQNSGGHCTLAIQSNCTREHITSYLETGTVPPNGTVCEVLK
jgi:poly(3-hydroxyalkanoate) synthetase